MEKNRIEVSSFCGGPCHPNLYQSLADRMFCPTPYPRLTRSLPSLTQSPEPSPVPPAAGTSASILVINTANGRRATLWPSYALFAESKLIVLRIVEGLCFRELRRAWRMHIASSKLSCSSLLSPDV